MESSRIRGTAAATLRFVKVGHLQPSPYWKARSGSLSLCCTQGHTLEKAPRLRPRSFFLDGFLWTAMPSPFGIEDGGTSKIQSKGEMKRANVPKSTKTTYKKSWQVIKIEQLLKLWRENCVEVSGSLKWSWVSVGYPTFRPYSEP